MHQTGASLIGMVLASLLLAACTAGAGAPTRSPIQPTPLPTPTDVPGATPPASAGNPGAGTGGGTGGNPGTGITLPGGAAIFPPGQEDNPLFGGDVAIVTPKPGQLNPHPVNVQLVRALVNEDRHVDAELRWWSGVAPCNVLDSVQMARDDAARTIVLTALEGSGGGDVACIEIAQLKSTVVDLGELASGSWTISATGDAPSINLVVP